ncbi:MAG: autotransporter-associated beta strand repeat-containing protein [Planctomycetes bacterium]|nr:autotransporter-associated beta strand repeat-containing protein [Planctomycetota bacterium]
MRKIIPSLASPLVYLAQGCMSTGHHHPLWRMGIVMLVALAGQAGSEPSAYAANATWNGTTDTVWATGTNWSATPVPGSGDTATFNNAGGASDILDLGVGGVTINTITFDSASAAAYTIGTGAQSLTLNNGGGITLNSNLVANQNVNANITLGSGGGSANFNITNSSTANTLTFNGARTFTGTASTGNVQNLNFSVAGASTFTGITYSVTGASTGISDGVGGGKVAVHKTGTGKLTFGSSSGSFNYTGGLYLDQGALSIVGNSNNIKAGTSLYIAGGTTLDSINQGAGIYADIASQWNGDWTFSGSMQMTLSSGGTVDLGATGSSAVRTVTANGSSLIISGIVSNGTNGITKGLTQAGTGTLALTGTSTYTGPTTITAGTISVGTVGVGNSVQTFGGLKNIGVPSSLGQPMTVADGTISIGTAGTLTYFGGGDVSDRVINLAGTSGVMTLNVAGQGPLILTNNFTATGAGSKTLTLTGATVTVGSVFQAQAKIDGVIPNNSPGNPTALTISNGIWTLAGANTFTGTTTLTGGRLSVGATANLGNANSLVFNGGTLQITGTTLNSYSSGSISGHAVTQTGTKTIGLDIYDAANTFTVSTPLAQTTGGLTKLGAGTLVLAAANTYTGATTIGAVGTATFGATTTSGGTLKVDAGAGGSLNASPVSALTFAGQGGTFIYDNTTASGAKSQNLGALSTPAFVGGQISTSDNTVQVTRTALQTVSLTFSSLAARGAQSTLNFVKAGAPGTNGTDSSINITAQGAGFIDKGVFFNGADYAAMNGVGTYVRALAYGTDANTAAVNTVTASNHVKLTATPANQGNITLLSLNLAGSGVNFNQNAATTLTVPAIIKSGGGTSTISGGTGLTPGTELVIRTDTASDILDINGSITGGFALTKSGAGTLKLSGSTSNAISTVVVNGGELHLNKSGTANAIGSATNFATTINSGALVKYTGNSTDQITTGGSANQGQININGTGQLDFNGTTDTVFNVVINPIGSTANTTPIINSGSGGTYSIRNLSVWIPVDGFTSRINTGSGTLSVTGTTINCTPLSGGQGQISGNLSASGETFYVTGGNAQYDLLIDATMSGTNIIKSGVGGTLRLTGLNTYNSTTSISAGTLAFNTIQNAGSSTPNALGTPAIGAASIIALSDTGILQYIGSTAGSSNRVINLTTTTGGVYTLDASGTTTFALSGGITNAGTAGTSALNLTGTGAGLESGAIANGTSPHVTRLNKNGIGTWTLSGANTYTGETSINIGTLQLGNGGGSGSLSPLSAISNNATLAFNRINTLTQGTDFSSVISGTGAVIQAGSGTTILNGTNTYAGLTTVSNGILNVQNASALGSTATGTTVSNGATLQIQGVSVGAEALTLDGNGFFGQNGALVNVSGTNNYAGLVTLASGSTIASDSGTLNLTNVGTITGAGFGLTLKGVADGSVASIIGTGTGPVTKTGLGVWTLSGANTYTGDTTISQGTLALLHASNNNIAGSTLITLASSAILDTTGLGGTADLVLASGQTLKGTGTVVGNLTVGSGSTIAPGNSPGTLAQLGNEVWDMLGAYEFEINDVGAANPTPTGTAGNDPGWDLLDITGTLTITATSSNPFTVELIGLTLANAVGVVNDFNNTASYAWMIADATSNVIGYTGTNQFTINDSQFAPLNPYGGTFNVVLGSSVGGDDTQVWLQYSNAVLAVPEPSTLALAALGLIGLGVAWWSKRRGS